MWAHTGEEESYPGGAQAHLRDGVARQGEDGGLDAAVPRDVVGERRSGTHVGGAGAGRIGRVGLIVGLGWRGQQIVCRGGGGGEASRRAAGLVGRAGGGWIVLPHGGRRARRGCVDRRDPLVPIPSRRRLTCHTRSTHRHTCTPRGGGSV